jgi:hypothetical protein
MPYPPRIGVKAMVCVHQAGSAHRAKNASIDRGVQPAGGCPPRPDSYLLIAPGDLMGDANLSTAGAPTG